MKIFISWSGDVSRKVAVALKDWLRNVIQAIEPFVSSEDIDRGSRWFTDISSELEEVNFGILCITPENITAPWVLFEAGALSKSVNLARVSPLLIGVKNSDLEGPLSQFNTTSIEKDDILKLVKTINKQLERFALTDQILEKTFEKWWPEMDFLFKEVIADIHNTKGKSSKPTRTDSEILEEILELTRGMSRQVAKDEDVKKIYRSLLLLKMNLPETLSKDYLSNTISSNGHNPGYSYEKYADFLKSYTKKMKKLKDLADDDDLDD